MSEFKHKSITTKGMELLAQAINGESLEFTRIEMGSGMFEGDIGSAESLVEVRQNLPITKITRKGSQVTLSTVLKIEDIISSYNWTEIGVYARGEDGVEVLYMYGHTTNSSFISMDSLNEKLINVTVLVANTTQVIAVIDDSLVYLTAEALKSHEVDHTTHQDIRQSVEEVNQRLEQIDISWEGITDKPQQFNPTQHRHDAIEIDNLPSRLPAEGGNSDTVGGVGIDTIYHTLNKPTKADVGLSNVPNYGVSDSVTSTSASFATSKAVKTAYDKALEAFQSANDGKNQIATAITGKGVDASGNDTFKTLADKINSISILSFDMYGGWQECKIAYSKRETLDFKTGLIFNAGSFFVLGFKGWDFRYVTLKALDAPIKSGGVTYEANEEFNISPGDNLKNESHCTIFNPFQSRVEIVKSWTNVTSSDNRLYMYTILK